MKALTLLSLSLLFLITDVSHARLIDRTAALVNSEVITNSDVDNFRKQIAVRKELDPFIAFFNYVPSQYAEVLDFLVQESLVLAKHSTSAEDIDQEISNIMRDNNLTLDVLKSVLASQNVSYENYRKIVGISIAKRRMIDRDLRPMAIITEDEVKNYYYTNKEFRDAKGGRKLLVSFDVVQVQVPSKKTANEIYSRLANGEDLDAVATSFLDQGVRKVELGVIREDQLAGPIRKSLEGLKVGESSKPITLSSDLHVIHRIKAISAPHDSVYEELKQRIRGVLFQRALKTQLSLWTDRAKEEAYVQIPTDKIK